MRSARSFFRVAVAAAELAAVATAQQLRIEPTVTGSTSFAIVLDKASWTAVADEAVAYRDAVQRDGLPTWILVDDWPRPEAVRDALRELYAGATPLEGAVLVGAIPVAMLRSAQHLTTAFKMDERRHGWPRSSVPSDCFYEDFDLVLTPLQAPEDGESAGDATEDRAPNRHYYALSPESPQRVTRDIYTARLLPPAGDADERHAAIATCLRRFAARDRTARPRLDRVLGLMGHGYLSESMAAWTAMLGAVGDTLPSVLRPGGELVALHHDRDRALEAALLRELADPALDLAILHSHGGDDRQYLTGAPPLPSATAQVEALRRYLRTQLRRARARGADEAATIAKFRERWQLPESWFDGAFEEESTRADTAAEAHKELDVDEVRAIACGAEVVDLDACFNGAFVAADYQAAAYLFGKGTVQVVRANSVNVAQDVWNDRYLHLLARGERVGVWHRARPHLESHLFGDPTFRFASQAPADVLRRRIDAAAPRLEALATAARIRTSGWLQVLEASAEDPSPLVRRAAVRLMGDVGDPGHLPVLLRAALRDSCERVAFEARDAVHKFDPDQVAAAFAKAVAALPTPPVGDHDTVLRRLQTPGFVADYRREAADRSLTTKVRLRAIRTFRLYRVHAVVPELLALAAAADEDAEVRAAAIEALGWFHFATTRGAIVAQMQELLRAAALEPAVRGEAIRTLRRLAEGPNDELLP